VIRYGSGVWGDHRRGMFRGATERLEAKTTGIKGIIAVKKSVDPTTAYTVSINCAHATGTQ
jgi:3,4-dihydroxy-2-butanone 4-phosphate synthase